MQLNKPSAFSVEALMSRESEFDNRRCRSIRHCVSTTGVQHVNRSHLNTSKSAKDINDPQSYAQAMLPSTSRTNNDQCEATRERNTGIRLRSLALRKKTWENGNTIQSRSLWVFFPLLQFNTHSDVFFLVFLLWGLLNENLLKSPLPKTTTNKTKQNNPNSNKQPRKQNKLQCSSSLLARISWGSIRTETKFQQ